VVGMEIDGMEFVTMENAGMGIACSFGVRHDNACPSLRAYAMIYDKDVVDHTTDRRVTAHVPVSCAINNVA